MVGVMIILTVVYKQQFVKVFLLVVDFIDCHELDL